MSLKVYHKAYQKEVTVTALIDPSKIEYGKASETTLKYKVGSGAPAAYKGHNGLDTAGGDGSPIYSVYDGVVRVNTYEKGGAGYYVSIGTDMDGKNYRLVYMHLKAKSKLKKGAKVKAGDLIGYQGNTGNSTGSHLHISVKVASSSTASGKTADPFDYVTGKKEEPIVFETGKWQTLNAMNVRKSPSTLSEKVGTLPKDTVIDVIAVTSNGWGKIAPDNWFCLADETTAYAKRVGDSELVDPTEYIKKLQEIREISDELAEALK